MSARVTTSLPHWFATLQVKVVKKQQSKLFALQGKGLRGAMARGKNYRILSADPADPRDQVADLRGQYIRPLEHCVHTKDFEDFILQAHSRWLELHICFKHFMLGSWTGI